MRINYVIVFVSDMDRSIAFYRDVMGLPLKFDSLGWTEFSTEGATLALHKTDPSDRDPSDNQLERAGRWRSGWSGPRP
jgi:catechol 2,3-dioxygenase-like lactoylglutathione lyase family enzyme